MSSGDRKQHQSRGLNYGAAVAGENVDFAGDANSESPGTRDRALLDRLKDALKPGDARRSAPEAKRPSGDTTHDGRHGGIEEVMEPGNRDYDEREEAHRGGVLDELGERGHAREGGRRRSILDTVQFGHAQPRGEEPKETKSGGLMDAVRRKSDSGRNDKYRDSSQMKQSDESRMPGGMYRTIRDEFLK